MVILEDIAEFLKKIYNWLLTFIKLFQLNCKIYNINKNKNKVFKELGIIVYEFYNVDKSLLEDDEIKSLIAEIKDYEIEVDELEKMIETIKNNKIEEKDEISNELLLENKEEEKSENAPKDNSSEKTSDTSK